MNITGTVRIDLSGYVEFGDLVVGDRAIHGVNSVFAADPAGRCFVVDVGRAFSVRWDARLVELLSEAEHVELVGSHPEGVRSAVERLRVALDERIPGPRSAS